MLRTTIIRDPAFKLHRCGSGHPECPERLDAIDHMLEATGLNAVLNELPARDASADELCYVHNEDYVSRIRNTSNKEWTRLDLDTAANRHSYRAATRAAGAVAAGTDALLSGDTDGVFAFVRPPGHHAERDHAKGFCLFNNVAIAAEHARRVHDKHRILIVDWDVHHGNGTMHSFYNTQEVLFVSLHQFPHYPGTGTIYEIGAGVGEGYTVNIPVPPGTGEAEYRAAFMDVVAPIASAYSPEVVLVSAGFDCHARDPLSSIRLESPFYAEMTLMLRAATQDSTNRMLVTLEGGYDLTALAEGTQHVLHGLLGEEPTMNVPSGSARTKRSFPALQELRDLLSAHWPL